MHLAAQDNYILRAIGLFGKDNIVDDIDSDFHYPAPALRPCPPHPASCPLMTIDVTLLEIIGLIPMALHARGMLPYLHEVVAITRALYVPVVFAVKQS